MSGSVSGTTINGNVNSRKLNSSLFALSSAAAHSYKYRAPIASDTHNAWHLSRQDITPKLPGQEMQQNWDDESHLYERLEVEVAGHALSVTGGVAPITPHLANLEADDTEKHWISEGAVGDTAKEESAYLYKTRYFWEQFFVWVYFIAGDRQIVEQPDMSYLLPYMMLNEHDDEAAARDIIQDRDSLKTLDEDNAEDREVFKKDWLTSFDWEYVLWFLRDKSVALRVFALKGQNRIRFSRAKVDQLFLWHDRAWNQDHPAQTRPIPTCTVDLPINKIDLVWRVRQFSMEGLQVLQDELKATPAISIFGSSPGMVVQITDHRQYEHFEFSGNSLEHDLILHNLNGPSEGLMVVVRALQDSNDEGSIDYPTMGKPWHNRVVDSQEALMPHSMAMHVSNTPLFSERLCKNMIYADNPRNFPLMRPWRVFFLSQHHFPKAGSTANQGHWDFSAWTNPRIQVKWSTSANAQLDARAARLPAAPASNLGQGYRVANNLKIQYSVYSLSINHLKYTPCGTQNLYTLEHPKNDYGTANSRVNL